MTESDTPRIGVIVCKCGEKISGHLDTEALCTKARQLPGVTYTASEAYPCSPDGLVRFRQAIQEHELTHALVAGCPSRLIRPVFQKSLAPTGLDPENVAMVDIREGCAFAHPDEPDAAQCKAEDQVRMGIAHLAATGPIHAYTGDIVQAALVIGSELGGLVTATTLADQGIPVIIIDTYRGPGQGLDPSDGDAELYQTQRETARHHPQITFLPEAQITAVAGQPGNYTVQVSRNGEAPYFHAGAIIVAIGIQNDKYPAPLSTSPAKSDLHPAFKTDPNAVPTGNATQDLDDLPLSTSLERNRELDSLASWLHLPQDIYGFLIKERIRLRPGQYVEDGVFVVSRAHRPLSGLATFSEALLVSARVQRFLKQETLRTESTRASIETSRCTGCGTCTSVCPAQAITLVNRPGILSLAQVAPLRCTGCGGCIAACPTRAIDLPGWEDAAILAQISAAFEAPPRWISKNGHTVAAPRLLAFTCEWSVHAAAELAGARRVPYPADLRFVPLNCAARFDPNHVLWAFLSGADGVLVGACPPGDCHHRTGNQLAAERLEHLNSQLADHGLDPHRLQLAQLSGDDVEAFVRIVTEFSTRFLSPDALIHRLDDASG